MHRRSFLVGAAALSLAPWARAVEKIEPDPAAEALLNQLLQALQIEDPDKRLAAVIPLVHKSLLTSNGKDLARSTKDFSYKKACAGAKLYKQPVEITEVHKGKVMAIGFQETAETGRTDKYFLAKKAGVGGLPAPIHVFWDSQGKPKIVNMGSL